MENLVQDIRYGLRMLWKSPAFTLIAVITLALGIGANTAIFSVVNAAVLQPLPYPESDRLMLVHHAYPHLGMNRVTVDPSSFLEYQRSAKSFEKLAAYTGWRGPQNLTTNDAPIRVTSILVTQDFFAVMGVPPEKGRGFVAEEHQPGANRAVVLGHAIWQQQFASDPDIIGKQIRLDGQEHTVVGLMPAGFEYPNEAQLWVPAAFTPQELSGGAEYLQVVGRLKPGMTSKQAVTEMQSITAEMRKRFNVPESSKWFVSAVDLHEAVAGDVKKALLVLLGTVGFVLLIACANVANLMMARAASRQKEVAIRSALGATRARIARQLLTEGVVLSLIGGAFGLVLAYWGVDFMLALFPLDLPSFVKIGVDGSVLGYVLGLSVLTGLIFAAVPALQASSPALNDTLKEGGRTSAGGSRHRVRAGLVALEMALALMLLVGAGLMIKSFAHLQARDVGFDPEGALTAGLVLPQARYDAPEKIVNFSNQLLERVASIPGVESAGLTTAPPLNVNWTNTFLIEGRDLTPAPHAHAAHASPQFFQTLRIPLRRGRVFNAADSRNAKPVAIVDELFVRAYFPDEDPIGKRIAGTFEGTRQQRVWREIVGVVGPVKHMVADETKGQVYFPHEQVPSRDMMVALRTSGDPTSLAALLRAEVQSLDREQPIFDVKTMQERVYEYLRQPRFNMVLIGAFAGLALVLAAVGIYGVISYSVAQRTQEIGIRMALGAQQADVMRMVLRSAMLLVAIGLGIGLAAALASTRVLQSLLFGVSTTDPATFAVIAVLLTTVALLASYIPARRATKVDPMVALRYE